MTITINITHSLDDCTSGLLCDLIDALSGKLSPEDESALAGLLKMQQAVVKKAEKLDAKTPKK